MNIGSLEEMKQCAKQFVHSLKPHKEATVIGLSGDLGSGKTTFVQCVAGLLGVEEAVTSPTFVIQKTYPLSGQVFTALVHIDAYRIEDPHELEVLRWNHTRKNPGNLIVIEWPEKIASLLPNTAKMIHFTYVDDTNREVVIDA